MKSLLFGLAALASFSVQAQSLEIRDISCSEAKIARNADTNLSIRFAIDSLVVKSKDSAKITYAVNFLAEEASQFAPLRTFEMTSFNAKDVSNVPYNGRKYEGHFKFEIKPARGSQTGNLQLEQANLIISPEYKVVKTYKQNNHWTPAWKWEVEVRKHSAVLDLSINDHHGDYVILDCYSTATVNEVRPRDL